MDLNQFHDTFFEESNEGLDEMETNLLNLEIGADNSETINTIFRGAHSIKGGSGTFGFNEIASFTHVMETLLDEIRGGYKDLTQDIIEVLLQSVDCLREMLSAQQQDHNVDTNKSESLKTQLERVLHDGKTEEEIAAHADSDEITEDEFEALLDQLHGKGKAPSTASQQSNLTDSEISEAEYHNLLHHIDKNTNLGWAITFRPGPIMLTHGNDPLRILRELSELGQMTLKINTDQVPAFSEIDPTVCYLQWEIELIGQNINKQDIDEIFSWVVDECEIHLEIIKHDQTELSSNPKPIQDEDVTYEHTGSSVDMKHEAITESVQNITTEVSNDVKNSNATNKAKSSEATSIRVGTDKVDALINMVGELVITQSMLSQMGKGFEADRLPMLLDGLAQLERNTRELQENVMRIRMLPISFTFNRFPRLVYDLSRKLDKKIELAMTGEQTELDKTVMEKIGDPLVHLVRNSIDHGIETPEQRLAAGKPECGILRLNAYHQGGNIVIEISDDGAGINRDRVLMRARERGLVTAGEVMSDEQIHNLIFEPGFSTAETISDVSGRGVGMDVVRKNIHALGGNVEISSTQGKGSTVTIRLPLTLAILDGQTVQVGEETYIVPLVSIIESIQIKENHVNQLAGGAEIIQLRGEYLAIVRLHEVFGVNVANRSLANGLLVVVEGNGQRIGLFVDELLGQQQVVIKSLEENYRKVEGLAGATILGDGHVALILDIPGIIKLCHERGELPDRRSDIRHRAA